MIAIDVGGTFTDVVAVDDEGNIRTVKVPSSVKIPEKSVLEGARKVGLKREDTLNHASTYGLNAILTRNFPKVAFLTTEGHRDILDFARAWKPMDALTDPHWRRSCGDCARPLVPRYLRRGIRERLKSNGEVLIPLDETQALKEIAVLKKCGVEGVAICLLNAYAHDRHEKRLKELVTNVMGNVAISISSEVCPLPKEYPRSSTTVVDVIMKLIYGEYVGRLRQGLLEAGFDGEINLVDSAAMLMPFELGLERPSRILFSGPAAGTVSCAHFGRLIGEGNIVCCDVGGTSTDISLIRDGKPLIKTEYEIEHDLIVKALAIEVLSIGQGGGSIVSVGRHGELLVGPEGVGGDPGPACYGMGGFLPTLTDAFLLIGILDEHQFLGGEKPLFPSLARQVYEALPFRGDLSRKIRGTYEIGLTNVAEGISTATIERGVDLRDFVLFAYGAAGPMILPQLMERLEIRKVVVPPYPGLFSALGLLSSDMAYTDYTSSLMVLRPDEETARRIDGIFRKMEEKILNRIGRRFPLGSVKFVRTFDGWYLGQTWETPFVPAPEGPIGRQEVEDMIKSFHKAYLERWGNVFAHLPIMACTYRVSCMLPTRKIEYKQIPERKENAPKGVPKRLAHIDEQTVMEYRRSELFAGDVVEGPAIIREPTSTTFVPSHSTATIGKYGEIYIERR